MARSRSREAYIDFRNSRPPRGNRRAISGFSFATRNTGNARALAFQQQRQKIGLRVGVRNGTGFDVEKPYRNTGRFFAFNTIMLRVVSIR